MRVIWAIFKKDFKSITTSPMFYVIGALVSSVWSYIFLRTLINFAAQSSLSQMYGQSQGGNLHYSVNFAHISLVNLLFIFAIPALTMKLLSEEKKQRTYDLLLTSPIHSFQITLGKFFAGWASSNLWVLIAFSYPLSTLFISDVNPLPLISAFLGCLLLSGLYTASGLFSSSLSSSAVLSVILGFLFNLTLWLVGDQSGTSGSSFMDEFLTQISLGKNFVAMMTGQLKISAVVYFLSGISVFLFLCERSIESARWRS